MKHSEAVLLKKRILACRQNELTKRIAIKKIFCIINQMVKPDAPTLKISKSICPRCGTIVHEWRIEK